ncbi:MAG TPA: glycosyltransferase [Rariglobus sp.]
MKIAQIVPSLEARHGGPSRSVRGLARGLAQSGHTVELLTTGPTVPEVMDANSGLTLKPFERQYPRSFACSRPLAHYLRNQKWDIIHHHGLWLRTLHYASAEARRSSAPLVISPRGMMSDWAWNHNRWKKRLASWFVHPGAFDCVRGWHATSEAEGEDIRRLGFTQPVCVAPNGVVAPTETETTAEAAHWHALLPALSGRRVALFYSRFHAKKRVIELIDLWLSSPRDEWVLLIAGIPEQYTVAQLDTYVVRNGGSGRVIIQDGVDRPPPYAIASLFLLPSHSENFGLVVAEALVRGIPVLATDGAPWQNLNALGAGACVGWSEYGRTLTSVLAQSAADLQAAGGRARDWARAEFSWDKAAATLSTFYQELARTG